MKKSFSFLFFLLILVKIDGQKPELILPVGHILHASDAIYSPDERFVLTASRSDNTAKLWESVSGKMFRTFYSMNGFTSLSFSPDGRTIMMITDYLNVTLWETLTGKLINTLRDRAFVNTASFSSDGDLVMTSTNHGINIWDAKSGKLVQSLSDTLKIYTPAFLSDENQVFYLSGNTGIIWNRSDNTTKQLFKESENISSCKFIDNETKILVEGLKHVVLYDRNTGQVLGTFGDGNLHIEAVELSENEKLLLIRYFTNYTPEIWSMPAGKLLYKLPHGFFVECAKFRPFHNTIFTTSSDMVRIWNRDNGAIVDSFKVENIDYGSFDRSGKYFLSNSMTADDFQASIWNIDLHRKSVVLEGSSYKLSGATFSPDDNYLLTSNFDMAKIWDIRNGKLLRGLTGHMRETNAAIYSYDGKFILTSSEDGTVRIWYPESGKFIKKIVDYWSSGIRPAISRDDSLAATGDKRKSCINLIDIATGKIIRTLSCLPLSLDFSPDGKLLASSGWDQTAKIWDVSTGNLLQTMTHTSPKVSGVSFSPDGRYIATASTDYADKIWDVSNGGLIAKLPHSGWVNSAEYSYDGNYIVTSSDDYTCKIWDAKDFRLVRTLQHPAPVQSASFNHKGNLIVTCAGDNLCRVWDSQSGDLLYSICSIGNEDYVFVLPSGEYMGTSNGVRKLSWRLNNKLYDFDQWDLQYNRPDKVLRQLGNQDKERLEMYNDAYKKRLKRAGFSENVFTDEWHAPEMKIIDRETMSGITDSAQVKLRINGSDSKYRIDRFFVWVNDIPVFGSNGISVSNESADSVTKTITVPLSSGGNMINVACMNEKGVESLKESVSVIYNPSKAILPDLYLISICVSKYLDNRYDLQYPVKDGKDIIRTFSSVQAGNKTFKRIIVDTLFNKNAIRDNFVNIKKKLLLTSVEDEVVVFVSGHGLLDKNLDFYYAAYNMDFSNPAKAGISFTQLENLLDSIPARKKLLLVDACHSGEVDKDEAYQKPLMSKEISPDITFRGELKEFSFNNSGDASSNQTGITLQNSFELMQELFSNLDRGTGATVISAAAGKGYALESPLWKNGVFTYSIINGMKNKAADKNGDGIITISELKDYSIKQVELLTGGMQKPTARRESINYDWRVW